mgnify:FL=1
MEEKTLIALKNTGVFRSDRWLIRGMTMYVDAGEIVTLIGPNGSGKSTTARMALGILRPDEGQIYQRPKLKVGYVPQKLDINWTLPLSVARFLRLTNKLSKQQVEEALAATQTLHLFDRQMGSLSGGEFQRVQIARALARIPDFIVLDEPVQGVDYNGELALYELIDEIRNRFKCGILLISHDLHMVMAKTDRVFCLNGHICCCGTPSKVTSSQEFKTLFGEYAASSLSFYQHQHKHQHLQSGEVIDGSKDIESMSNAKNKISKGSVNVR